MSPEVDPPEVNGRTDSMHRGCSVPAVVTGKPVAISGSQGRSNATSAGLVHAIDLAAARTGMKLDGCRVAVQGVGSVGIGAVDLLPPIDWGGVEGGQVVGFDPRWVRVG